MEFLCKLANLTQRLKNILFYFFEKKILYYSLHLIENMNQIKFKFEFSNIIFITYEEANHKDFNLKKNKVQRAISK